MQKEKNQNLIIGKILQGGGRSMDNKMFVPINDPCFYQYTRKKELESFNTSELTIALSVLRKEQRRLKEKVYKKRADSISRT